MSLLRWFLGERTPKEGEFRKQLEAFRAATVDGDLLIKPPTYVPGMETPERDELKPSCVHLYSDADELAEELKRETAGQKVKPFRKRQ